ncbi:DnaB-like helicase C-terminal domain-containing protein [Candidatus Endomicrobiellum agilis]|uniref:DnaB-like helicase C-terminal domain-containing protein n=1 Tax=Candidatus Endomicrobiellum agilis TaxID=3238957 RepID=UPI0035A8E6EF
MPEFAKTTQKRKILYVNLEINYWQIIHNLHLPLMYDSANYNDRNKLPTEDILNLFSCMANLNRKSSEANEVFQKAYEQKSKYVEWLPGKKIIQIYNGISATNEDIMNSINTHTSEDGIVLIDYIQRMPAEYDNARQPRQVQLQKVSAGLLKSAIENQIVITAGAQFNRQSNEEKADMINIRECGGIEQDAFNIVAIVNKDENNRYIDTVKAREGGEMFEKGHVEATKKYIHWEVTREEDDDDDDSGNGRSSGEVNKNKADEKEKRVTFYDGKEWS